MATVNLNSEWIIKNERKDGQKNKLSRIKKGRKYEKKQNKKKQTI